MEASEGKATMTLMNKIIKEDEGEFTLKSSDFWRPPLKQIRDSVYKIKEYFVREGLNIAPKKLLPPLSDIQHKLLRALRNTSWLSQSLTLSHKPDRAEGFIFISDSMSVALDFTASDRPNTVICDVFIALPREALLVLTVVSSDKDSDPPRIYNVSVASGLTKTLRRFMKEPVNTSYGVVSNSLLTDIPNFEVELKKMVEHASLSVTGKSLSMNRKKFDTVLMAFWAGVAETKSIPETEVNFLRFLTMEQCIVLIENINHKRSQVRSLPGCGATTLMLEVARRLSRMDNTLLVCRSVGERERLRSVFPSTVSHTDISRTDLSHFPNVIDETGTVTEAPNCLWQFTQANDIEDEDSLHLAANTTKDQISLKEKNSQDEDFNQRTVMVALIEIPKVSGPVLQFDDSLVNTDVCHINRSKELVNQPLAVIVESSDRFQTYKGTSTSSPIPFPISFLQQCTSQYLEVYTDLVLKKSTDVWQSIMEFGIIEVSHLDCSNSLKEQPRSWGIKLGGCCDHFPDLCLQVYEEGRSRKCVPTTLANKPGTRSSCRYGILINFCRRRVVFLNIDMGSMIHKSQFEAREDLCPIFGFGLESDDCDIKMELICGRDVSITERKRELIHNVLAMD